MTKRTNLIFLALIFPLFLQAQMEKGLFTIRPDIGISKGVKNIAYYGGTENFGKLLNISKSIETGLAFCRRAMVFSPCTTIK